MATCPQHLSWGSYQLVTDLCPAVHRCGEIFDVSETSWWQSYCVLSLCSEFFDKRNDDDDIKLHLLRQTLKVIFTKTNS